MSLLDNFSGNLDDLKSTVKDFTELIKNNSKELKEQTAIRLEISKEERKLASMYRDIGETFYKEHNKLSNHSNDYIESKIGEIDIVVAKIESLKMKLETGFTAEKTEGDFKSGKPESIVYIDEEDLNK
ncbi:hypothetical protein [Anaerosphaera multitolerans]|uniref:Uncharacterized protein n=1 Tax=Anaerosphaera multitolerans TaxID=2487351 RepID=A0A437S7X8_9FIRM|nr:hypothetical protein [Anaerosphaera multitolerans]RVU55112.1 hypothetical protein EF514_04270 [Anaerosphaera multitolerans]